MPNWNNLINGIKNVIKQNGRNAITGDVLQDTLVTTVRGVGEHYRYVGIAELDTAPGNPDGFVFYMAREAGVYKNFGNIKVGENAVTILKNTTTGSWIAEEMPMPMQYEMKWETLFAGEVVIFPQGNSYFPNPNFKYIDEHGNLTVLTQNTLPQQFLEAGIYVLYLNYENTLKLDYLIEGGKINQGAHIIAVMTLEFIDNQKTITQFWTTSPAHVKILNISHLLQDFNSKIDVKYAGTINVKTTGKLQMLAGSHASIPGDWYDAPRINITATTETDFYHDDDKYGIYGIFRDIYDINNNNYLALKIYSSKGTNYTFDKKFLNAIFTYTESGIEFLYCPSPQFYQIDGEPIQKPTGGGGFTFSVQGDISRKIELKNNTSPYISGWIKIIYQNGNIAQVFTNNITFGDSLKLNTPYVVYYNPEDNNVTLSEVSISNPLPQGVCIIMSWVNYAAFGDFGYLWTANDSIFNLNGVSLSEFSGNNSLRLYAEPAIEDKIQITTISNGINVAGVFSFINPYSREIFQRRLSNSYTFTGNVVSIYFNLISKTFVEIGKNTQLGDRELNNHLFLFSVCQYQSQHLIKTINDSAFTFNGKPIGGSESGGGDLSKVARTAIICGFNTKNVIKVAGVLSRVTVSISTGTEEGLIYYDNKFHTLSARNVTLHPPMGFSNVIVYNKNTDTFIAHNNYNLADDEYLIASFDTHVHGNAANNLGVYFTTTQMLFYQRQIYPVYEVPKLNINSLFRPIRKTTGAITEKGFYNTTGNININAISENDAYVIVYGISTGETNFIVDRNISFIFSGQLTIGNRFTIQGGWYCIIYNNGLPQTICDGAIE